MLNQLGIQFAQVSDLVSSDPEGDCSKNVDSKFERTLRGKSNKNQSAI